MTSNNKIPVLNTIVQAGKPSLIQEQPPNRQNQAKSLPAADTDANTADSPHLAKTAESIGSRPLPTQAAQDKEPDDRQKELQTQAEILLGIMEEKLGIYLIRRRKKLLDALVEQLRNNRN